VLLLPPRAVDGGVFAVWEAVGVARPAVVPPGPLCIAADLTWLEQEHMALLPPTLLRAFRDRARPPPGRRVAPARLFVHGLGETAPAALLRAAEAEGYRPLDLRDLAPRDVLAAFAGATAIAGASGPDLDGIIFCAPGTKVLEIAPADRFLPFAWMISEKIGLLHAVLPGGAPARFARLASMLRNWEP
ncbi:MAG TPA: hypothetical protein VMB71_05240, partial [Acetobacteraceae bacterium]|nr:hypothetical protein [Acetobacteraceae bacterium]